MDMKPNVAVGCGAQYGSEGKGKVSKYLAELFSIEYAVRVGGPNSGHTVYDKHGTKHILRCVPSAAVDNPNVTAILPPGNYIDLDILLEEIEKYNLRGRIFIDPNAVIITDVDRRIEEDLNLTGSIGSTCCGVGAAAARRAMRLDGVMLAKNCELLKEMIAVSSEVYHRARCDGSRIIIEGTQGFGLSIYHTECYPFATARDTTAAGFISEAGISPLWVEHIALVMRAYPIRVGGNSGPMKNEINWETIGARLSVSKDEVKEFTSVTHRPRRVAEFDIDQVNEAIRVNDPDILVLNHLDHVEYSRRFGLVKSIAGCAGKTVDYVGLSPDSLCPACMYHGPTPSLFDGG